MACQGVEGVVSGARANAIDKDAGLGITFPAGRRMRGDDGLKISFICLLDFGICCQQDTSTTKLLGRVAIQLKSLQRVG